MIVKACDICRKLLAEAGTCVVMAVRDKSGALLFKKGGDARGASHFCSEECAFQFFQKWMNDELPQIEMVDAVDHQPARPTVIVVPPDPEDASMRNQILASVIGRG